MTSTETAALILQIALAAVFGILIGLMSVRLWSIQFWIAVVTLGTLDKIIVLAILAIAGWSL